MGIATFTDFETGEDVYIDTNGAIIGSVGRGDRGTIIVRHIPDPNGRLRAKKTIVREDFWNVIDTLALARLR